MEPLPAAPSEPQLDEFRRHNLGWLLMRVAHDFRQRAQREFVARGHAGMQSAHAMVLVHLPMGGGRLTDLAAHAGVTKQAMGQLVDDMERLGYVERAPDPADGRAKHIRFTEAGIALLSVAREILAEIWAGYAELLGERRLGALRNSLDALLERIDSAPAATRSVTQDARGRPQACRAGRAALPPDNPPS